MRKYQAPPAYPQSPHSTAAGARGAIDSFVQGSLVDLFAAYNVAVAPRPRTLRISSPTLPDMSAAIGFSRQPSGQQGRLSLSLPSSLLELMSPSTVGSLQSDWTRELANQLMGRIKNRLLPFNVRLRLGVSSGIESAKLAQRLEASQDLRVYTGRALRGELVVTLEGLPDDTELSYVGQTNTPSEGATLLF